MKMTQIFLRKFSKEISSLTVRTGMKYPILQKTLFATLFAVIFVVLQMHK